MIYWKKGNLLESDCDYICQQVNCQGKMNSGIAKQIREKWPVVYQNYKAKYEASKQAWLDLYGGYEDAPGPDEMLLGNIQIVGLWENFYETDFHQSVINMFAQQHYGYDKPIKHIHVSVDGMVSYNSILYIPEKTPYDFYKALGEFYSEKSDGGKKHSRIDRYNILLDFADKVITDNISKSIANNMACTSKNPFKWEVTVPAGDQQNRDYRVILKKGNGWGSYQTADSEKMCLRNPMPLKVASNNATHK